MGMYFSSLLSFFPIDQFEDKLLFRYSLSVQCGENEAGAANTRHYWNQKDKLVNKQKAFFIFWFSKTELYERVQTDLYKFKAFLFQVLH